MKFSYDDGKYLEGPLFEILEKHCPIESTNKKYRYTNKNTRSLCKYFQQTFKQEQNEWENVNDLITDLDNYMIIFMNEQISLPKNFKTNKPITTNDVVKLGISTTCQIEKEWICDLYHFSRRNGNLEYVRDILKQMNNINRYIPFTYTKQTNRKCIYKDIYKVETQRDITTRRNITTTYPTTTLYTIKNSGNNINEEKYMLYMFKPIETYHDEKRLMKILTDNFK